MKKIIFTFTFTFTLTFTLSADPPEGMWLPFLLDQLTIKDMQANGCKLSAEDIYSVNHSSLKDAVLIFGGGCTGEVISNEGLVLTNHHCGLGQIQSHSSVEHDYIKNGFWAMNKGEELPCGGLTVTFIIRMEDVTAKALKDVTNEMSEDERDEKIEANTSGLAQAAVEGTHYTAQVRPFYSGNQFFLIVMETFRDVRLVGAPPEAIGNFGGDADNWIWPRHTGDFSLFRIYADKNNNPADYAADNIPFKPRYSFPISLKGEKEGDFTMVYGFPGRTTEYISSYAVDLVQNIYDPERVAIRDVRLKIWWDAMMKNDSVRIKYASKYYGLSNGWKKWQGEVRGLKKANAIEMKQEYETEFTNRISKNANWSYEYKHILPDLKIDYDSLHAIQTKIDYYNEALFAPEIFKLAPLLQPLIDSMMNRKTVDEGIRNQIEKIKSQCLSFYKDFDAMVDEKMFAATLDLFCKNAGVENAPIELQNDVAKFSSNNQLSAWMFQTSMLDNQNVLLNFLSAFKKGDEKKLMNDPAYKISLAVNEYYNSLVLPMFQRIINRVNILNRQYMQAQMEVFPEKKFYPDANFSLRVAYGKVEHYHPKDAVDYSWFTTLDGVMGKYIPADEFYDAPQKLIDLYHNKDYGQYADADGSLHTCFIASNHTTGGNSGSPVIDAEGHLIGTNFDRCWEGTMSDIYFDPNQCRNIAVDVRYTLFIIDKYADAGYLLNEMDLVK